MLALASFSLVVPSYAQAQDMSDKNIVEIAAANGDFSTLVAAVKAADLATTLSGEGPFTVFAPTNDAFADLPEGLVAALLKPENKATLQKILTYHVVSGKLMAGDVVEGITTSGGNLSAATVAGSNFNVMTMDDAVKIKDGQGAVTTVTATDITGSNGVIHVIDRVLLPADVNPAALLKEKGTAMTESRVKKPTNRSQNLDNSIAKVASGNDNFETLVTALGAAGFVDMFDSPGEYTVFAPTDAAFDKLPEGTVGTLVKPENKEKLQGILAYHVVPARITATQLMAAIEKSNGYYLFNTVANQTLVASIKDGKVKITDGNGNTSTVIMTDVDADNGIIHAIDSVLMPK